jgi:hypothetical protein
LANSVLLEPTLLIDESAGRGPFRRCPWPADDHRRQRLADERNAGNSGMLCGHRLRGGSPWRWHSPPWTLPVPGRRRPHRRGTQHTPPSAGRPSADCMTPPARAFGVSSGRLSVHPKRKQLRRLGPEPDRGEPARLQAGASTTGGLEALRRRHRNPSTTAAHVKGNELCPGRTRKPPSRPSRARPS